MPNNDKECLYSKQDGFSINPIEPSPAVLKGSEVLIRTEMVGICGSDLYHLETYEGDKLRLGHEWTGQVLAIGPQVKALNISDRVTSSAVLACGKCSHCEKREYNFCVQSEILGSENLGALRSWMVIEEHNLLKTTEPNLKAATLLEVIAVGEQAYLHLGALKNTNGPTLIFGAGSVGLCVAEVAKRQGVKPILIELCQTRKERAERLGHEAYTLSQALMNPKFDHHFGIIFDASGDHCDGKGAWNFIAHFGKKEFAAVMIAKYTKKFSFNPDALAKLSARLIWMRGVHPDCLIQTIKNWEKTEALRRLSDELVSHVFQFETEITKAFETAGNQNIAGKVMIKLT